MQENWDQETLQLSWWSTFLRTSSCVCPSSRWCGVMFGRVGMQLLLSISYFSSPLLESSENFFPFSRSDFSLELPPCTTPIVSNFFRNFARLRRSSESGETSLRFLPSAAGLPLPLKSPSLRKESSMDERLLRWRSLSRMQQLEKSTSPLMGGSLSWLRPCGKTLSVAFCLRRAALRSARLLLRSSWSMLRSVLLASCSISRLGEASMCFLNWRRWRESLKGGESRSWRSVSSLQGVKQLAWMIERTYFICIKILSPCTKKHHAQRSPFLQDIRVKTDASRTIDVD